MSYRSRKLTSITGEHLAVSNCGLAGSWCGNIIVVAECRVEPGDDDCDAHDGLSGGVHVVSSHGQRRATTTSQHG